VHVEKKVASPCSVALGIKLIEAKTMGFVSHIVTDRALSQELNW